MTRTFTLTGTDAITYATEADLPLCKYADFDEGERDDLTPEEAADIARTDPNLIYIDVDLTRAEELFELADEGGTIQGGELVDVFWDPRDHRTMSLREAWCIAYPSLGDRIAEIMFG